MSIAFVQLGQCGNQIGHAMFEFLNQEAQYASPAAQAVLSETFYLEKKQKQIAKALLIDMEPKVVDRCLKADYYDSQFSLTKQEGSGNNWAYGYNVHGPANQNNLINMFDSLLEESGYIESVFFMSSLAGGTGSGLGSYLLELFADRYDIEFFNICVVPHLTGEVILQSLNTTLTVASLYQNTQGIIFLQNDEAQSLCNHLLNLKSPTLNDINTLMSTNLASIFWPALTSSAYSTFQNNFQYTQELLNIVDNQYKFLQLNQIPSVPINSKAFQNDSWVALEKRIQQMILTGTKEYNINWHKKGQVPYKSLMIARGTDVKKHQFSWNTIYDEHQFNKNDKSITAIHNSQNVFLNQLSERATQMIQERAYLYQYEKFGVSLDDFQESLAIVEGIINDYEQL